VHKLRNVDLSGGVLETELTYKKTRNITMQTPTRDFDGNQFMSFEPSKFLPSATSIENGQ